MKCTHVARRILFHVIISFLVSLSWSIIFQSPKEFLLLDVKIQKVLGLYFKVHLDNKTQTPFCIVSYLIRNTTEQNFTFKYFLLFFLRKNEMIFDELDILMQKKI